jgi:hypothetical protein
VNPRENQMRAQKKKCALQAEIREIRNNNKKKNDSAIARGFQPLATSLTPPPTYPPPRTTSRHGRCGPPSARSSRWTRPPTTTPPRPRPSSAP